MKALYCLCLGCLIGLALQWQSPKSCQCGDNCPSLAGGNCPCGCVAK